MRKISALIVDPQNDFMGNDDGTPHSVDAYQATLAVKGGAKDMWRMACLLSEHGAKIDHIHVTLDTETIMDIGHAAPWLGAKNNSPMPFTKITAADVDAGMWRARDPRHQEHFAKYCRYVEKRGRVHVIWPEHCLIGTWGHAVYYFLNSALWEWQWKHGENIDYVFKSMNPLTEQYGALVAAMPNEDPTTHLNKKLLAGLEAADQILVGGEASSHCVADTARQLVKYGSDGIAKKMVLLTDCMSPVAGFEVEQDKFFAEMRAAGATFATSTEWRP